MQASRQAAVTVMLQSVPMWLELMTCSLDTLLVQSVAQALQIACSCESPGHGGSTHRWLAEHNVTLCLADMLEDSVRLHQGSQPSPGAQLAAFAAPGVSAKSPC